MYLLTNVKICYHYTLYFEIWSIQENIINCLFITVVNMFKSLLKMFYNTKVKIYIPGAREREREREWKRVKKRVGWKYNLKVQSEIER